MNKAELVQRLTALKKGTCVLYIDNCKDCPAHGEYCCALAYIIRAIEWKMDEEKENDT